MEKTKINRAAAHFFKPALCGLIALAAINRVSAATVDWKGTTNTDWGTGTNWSSGSAPASGDAVRIGVVAFTNQPTLNSGATTTIASLTFGTSKNITLTINSGFTLAVTGAIIQNSNNAGNITTTIAGAGMLTGASLTVGNSDIFPPVLAVDQTEVISTISNFHVTGDVTVNSTDFGVLLVGVGLINATFSLEGGTTTIDGTLLTANTNSGVLSLVFATPKFSVDIPSGSALSPVLQLTNAAPINTASVAGTIDFYNNTGGTGTSTVYYNGASQEVYANGAASLDNTPQTYQYLELTGAGPKTVDAGTLTVGNDLTSSTTSVLLSTNNTTATIEGSWTNSSNVTQGSGNITITNALQNTAGTFQLGTGSLTTAVLQNTGGTIAGGAGPGVVTVSTTFQNNGGTFQCNAENDFINGLYQNTSVFTAGAGTVYFNGSAAQSLSDISASGTQFNNVSFSGTSLANPKIMSGSGGFAVSPTGVLYMVGSTTKLVAGTAATAYLTLKSDTTGTATVAAIPSGSLITGFVTVQRFVQGNANFSGVTHRWLGRNYRLMSSPVNEGADAGGNYPYSINYLGAGTIITDCTSSYGTTAGNPSLYLFNEHYTPSNATFTSGNFIGVTDINNTLTTGHIATTDVTNSSANVYAGDGYMMYFRGDKVTHISGSPSKTSYPYVSPESVIFNATGNLNQGTYSVVSWTGTAGLLYTTTNAGNSAIRGFNLVGNPYPSSIDWSTFSNASSGAAIYGNHVNPTIYILNPATSNYDTYNASTHISTGIAGNIIPSGQGFFVQANNSSPTLTFNESAKTNSQVTSGNLLMGTPVGQTAYNSYIRLKVVIDSSNYDDAVIGFDASSTTNYDPNTDSGFLPGAGAVESIAAISTDRIKTSAKWVPFPKNAATQAIKLFVSAKASGQYTIQRTDFSPIPAIYKVWLIDNYKKDSLDIRHNTTYVFDIDLSDTASYGSDRFAIVVRQDAALAVHLLSFSAVKVQSGSQITWTTENEENYTNFTIQRSTDGGVTFSTLGGIVSNGQATYDFLDNYPLQGSNTYRLLMQDLNGVSTYSNAVTLVYGNTSAAAGSNISIYPNPVNGIINLSIGQLNGEALSNLMGAGQTALQNLFLTPHLVTPLATGSSSYSIRIVDIAGSVVKESSSFSNNWQSDISRLTPGTYIIQVQNKTNNSTVGRTMFVKM